MKQATLLRGTAYVLHDGRKFEEGVPQVVTDEVAEYLATREVLDRRGNVVSQFRLEAATAILPASTSRARAPEPEIEATPGGSLGYVDLGGVGVRHA